MQCAFCRLPLRSKGGIMLTPPAESTNGVDVVLKVHICVQCWGKVVKPFIGDQLMKAEAKFQQSD